MSESICPWLRTGEEPNGDFPALSFLPPSFSAKAGDLPCDLASSLWFSFTLFPHRVLNLLLEKVHLTFFPIWYFFRKVLTFCLNFQGSLTCIYDGLISAFIFIELTWKASFFAFCVNKLHRYEEI